MRLVGFVVGMAILLGTDVSAAQGAHLDWPAIAASGVRFAICKATEHVGYTDPTFTRNAVAAAQAGVIVGSYHVLRPEADVDRQARHYFDVAAARSELLPVLDFELSGGVAGPEVHRRAIAFVEATEALWGRPCIVYTGVGFWNLIGEPRALTLRLDGRDTPTIEPPAPVLRLDALLVDDAALSLAPDDLVVVGAPVAPGFDAPRFTLRRGRVFPSGVGNVTAVGLWVTPSPTARSPVVRRS